MDTCCKTILLINAKTKQLPFGWEHSNAFRHIVCLLFNISYQKVSKYQIDVKWSFLKPLTITNIIYICIEFMAWICNHCIEFMAWICNYCIEFLAWICNYCILSLWHGYVIIALRLWICNHCIEFMAWICNYCIEFKAWICNYWIWVYDMDM